jgi:LDH2 family malate/lactate/ureidoglycolate dehydrogenase
MDQQSPVPEQSARFKRNDLCGFAEAILKHVGIEPEASAVTADILVRADERGVSTHGLVRLVPYVRRIEEGLVNTRPSLRLLSDHPSLALIDADDGLGQVAASAAVDEAMKKVRATGVAVVGVHNSHHLGMCAPYAEKLARAGYVAFAMTNTAALMAPTGGSKRLLGNNPIAAAIPRAGNRDPITLDIAFTHAAFGMVQKLKAAGKPIPDGWMHDEGGNWINDPDRAVSEGIMAPIGAHKGYGLALIVEFLTGALTGSSVLSEVGSLFRSPPTHMRVGHLIIAIDPGRLVDPEIFLARVEEICRLISTSPPVPGVDKVKLPGEIEFKAEERSRQHGIALTSAICADLVEMAERFNIEFPEPMAAA